jgi:hypothetical protein
MVLSVLGETIVSFSILVAVVAFAIWYAHRG